MKLKKKKKKNGRHFLFQTDVKEDVVFAVGLKPAWLQLVLLPPGENGPGALISAP